MLTAPTDFFFFLNVWHDRKQQRIIYCRATETRNVYPKTRSNANARSFLLWHVQHKRHLKPPTALNHLLLRDGVCMRLLAPTESTGITFRSDTVKKTARHEVFVCSLDWYMLGTNSGCPRRGTDGSEIPEGCGQRSLALRTTLHCHQLTDLQYGRQ